MITMRYESVELEIIKFDSEDIITQSGIGEGSDEEE